MTMGDENAAGQPPAEDQEQPGTEGAGTSGSIYSGGRENAEPGTGDKPATPEPKWGGATEEGELGDGTGGDGTDSTDSGDDADGGGDAGSIYSG
jgi:hypothetical protein